MWRGGGPGRTPWLSLDCPPRGGPGGRARDRAQEAGHRPSDACAPAVSEPNLKLRYKPKKSLERRKNPLLRKESAPPSLRRRPAETLGGEAPRGGLVAGLVPFGQAPSRQGCPPQGCCGWLSGCVPHTWQGASWGCTPTLLAWRTSALKKGHLRKMCVQRHWRRVAGRLLPALWPPTGEGSPPSPPGHVAPDCHPLSPTLRLLPQ